MKKILTTILAGTMVAGAAFAVDAKIALNFRSRLDAFSQVTHDNGAKELTSRNWMNWNGYAGASSDNFDFRLDGERAGARLTWAINTGDGLINKCKQYTAWMNFPIGPGVLTLETGKWGDGYVDGNYRVKKDVDAMNAEGLDFERFKLGTILAGSTSFKFVDDLSNNGQGYLSGFASYKFGVTDDISFNITVGGVSNTGFDSVTDDDTTSNWKSALSSRVQFGMKGLLNAELIYKKYAPGYNTFALYVMPQILDALTLNVGGAVETFNGKGGKDESVDWAVDLRVRYQVMDPFSITFYTNVSGTDLDKGRKIANSVVGYGDNQSDYGKGGYATSTSFKTAMWNQLGLRYKINDLLTATLNLGLITPLAKAKNDDNSYSPEWRVVPAVQIYAASNASIWAGVALSGASWEDGSADKSTFAVNVPVIFRVKM